MKPSFTHSHSDESSQKAKSAAQVCATGAAVPLDETGVEFDEDKIDRIELFYEDSPEATIRATVNRLLSDRDEGMGLV